jgi:hypothetical protein
MVPGGHLASIANDGEAQFIGSLTSSVQPRWIGGKRENNSFSWTDGSSFDLTPFSSPFFPLEPNNLNGRENCLSSGHNTMTPSWKINDAPCETLRRYVCEVCTVY